MTVAAPASAALPAVMQVVEARRELGDTVTLIGAMAYPFAPGQFSMLSAFGVGEAPISLSGDPAEPGRPRHTIRAVGAVSAALARAAAGSRIGVRGPFGTPWPLEAARGADVLILSGGLGLAPLRPLILHLLARAGHCRRIALIHGARTPDAILFRDDLARWAKAMPVKVTVDRAAPDWTGDVGVVPRLIGPGDVDPDRTTAFVCGPEVMMRFTAARLAELGVPDERVFLSLERHMACGHGLCGRCQLGPLLLCRDGPVVSYARVRAALAVREL